MNRFRTMRRMHLTSWWDMMWTSYFSNGPYSWMTIWDRSRAIERVDWRDYPYSQWAGDPAVFAPAVATVWRWYPR